MAKLTFGIGGYGEKERRYLATVHGDMDKIRNLFRALQDCGFWTVVEHLHNDEPTVIEIGEVITQRMS